MTLTEIIQERGLEGLGRYYGKYRGVVVDNNDPNNQNKLLVQVPGILNCEPILTTPSNQRGGVDFGFKQLTPRKGEIVWVEFENGIPLKGIWSYHGWANGETPEEFNIDTFGFKTPKGNKVIWNEVDGSLYVKVIGKSTIETDDEISVTSKSKVTVISEKELTIKGSTINLIEGEEGLLKAGKTIDELNEVKSALRKVISLLRSFSPTGTSADTATWQGLLNSILPPTVQVNDTQLSSVINNNVKQEK